MRVSTSEPSASHEGAIRLHVSFSRDELHIRETPVGLDIRLKDAHSNAGEPGSPALPRLTIRVALPADTWPLKIDIRDHQTRTLVDRPVLVAPVQPLRPGVRETRPPHQEDEFVVEPFPEPPFVPPNPEYYLAVSGDRTIARPTGLDYLGLTPVLSLELRPVRLTSDGHLEFTTDLDLIVNYGRRPEPDRDDLEKSIERLRARGIHDVDPSRLAPLPEAKVVSRAQAERLSHIARDLVVNAEVVDRGWKLFPEMLLPADYLIITDNQSWDAATMTPTGSLTGDLEASFERLAAWKRSRGVTARVVTVTEIVSGRFGDFRSGARDLQEVIRRFVKWAHDRWGVAWLLIGGDVNVVPARLAAGAVEGHMDLTDDDPPGDNRSHWTGTFLKMRVVNPGTWWPGSWTPILINSVTGQLIPFDSTGATATSGTGWYYTTSDTYATRATMPTNFVRVNGPAGTVNARLQWLYEWNQIPTDFYYASLASWVIAYQEIGFWLTSFKIPYVYFPPHDWDALDNGLYGQFVGGEDIDGVLWHADVSVGRAPVESAAEANAFVDKVIAYEAYGPPDGWLNSEWPRRLVIAASNWGDPVSISSTAADPPGDDRYHTGTGLTVIKLATAPGDFDRQLIAEISASDRRELPFTVGGGTARGWHYATSATNHTPPTFTFTIWNSSFTFPIPSQWIVVHGPAEELAPSRYYLDHVGQDGSMADQEQLREQLRVELPGWNDVSRYYKDETDLTPAQAAAAPIQHLTSPRIQNAMNTGPHVVSLSGHGSGWGCCGADTWLASTLTNGWHTFIVYADSCLTNQIDMADAFSEELLKNPNGGAVAYVGNTRFSWIGVGDDVQRAFFHRLTTTRHLGLMNDSRLQALDFAYWHAYARWIMFSLNLLGDPEMRVWRTRQRRLVIAVEWKNRYDIPLKILVREPKPGEPNERVLIHVRAGDQEWREFADRSGAATFDLAAVPEDVSEVTVTVSADDAIPVVRRLMVSRPVWVEGTVTAVHHRDRGRNETRVDIDSCGECLSLMASGDDRDYVIIVAAAAAALAAQRPIAFLVRERRDGGRIERFRL